MDAPGTARQLIARSAVATREGRHDEAVSLLERATEQSPGDHAMRYRLAEALVSAGRVPDAIEQLRTVISADAKRVQPLRLLGLLQFQQGLFDDAQRVFRSLMDLRPKSSEFVDAFAKCQMARGESRGAIRTIESAITSGVPSDPLTLTLARACFRAGVLDRAESLLTGSGDPERIALLAQVYERQRRYDDAIDIANASIAANPDDDTPHRVIARVDRSRGSLDAARARLADLLQRPLRDESRAHVCMELGQVLDDLGDYPEAMAMFERGHALFTAHNPSLDRDAGVYLARLRRSAAGVDPEEIRGWETCPPEDGLAAPVFLVGFPRSGTTLFERIIGGLQGVTTSDEAPMLVETINARLRLGGAGLDPMMIPTYMRDIDEATIRSLRARYWASAREHVGVGPTDGTLIDKHPMNTPLLPVIRRLFPDARVVCALRDPRDAVLSAYMQDMVPSRAMLHIRTLRFGAELYDAMMSQYRLDRDRLGLRVHETRYEDLLTAPESTAKRLVEFLGGVWDDSILRFAERANTRRSGVNPYSTSRDLFRSSYGRWRRYATQIAQIQDVLSEHLQKFGYAE